MRISNHIIETLQRRKLESAEVAGCLLMYPFCLDGDSRREKAYEVAIQYLKEKKEDSKRPEGIFSNGRLAIELRVLLNSYEENEGEAKQNYARLIASKLVETNECYLMRVPEETKDVAFQIAIQYLEEQMRQ